MRCGRPQTVRFSSKNRLYQNCTKTLCNWHFGAYFEREADSLNLLKTLKTSSKGWSRWSARTRLQSRCSPLCVPDPGLLFAANAMFSLGLAWVQDWVQPEKQEWLRVLCKRHQTRHLDFCPPRLLTESLQRAIFGPASVQFKRLIAPRESALATPDAALV